METGHGIVQKNTCKSQLDEFCTENTTSSNTNMTEKMNFLFIAKVCFGILSKIRNFNTFAKIVDINHLSVGKWIKKIVIFT